MESNISFDLVSDPDSKSIIFLQNQIWNNLKLIRQIYNRIDERALENERLLTELTDIERLIFRQIKIWNFRRKTFNIIPPEQLKNTLEQEYFITLRQKISVKENFQKDILPLEKENRIYWREILELTNRLKWMMKR